MALRAILNPPELKWREPQCPSPMTRLSVLVTSCDSTQDTTRVGKYKIHARGTSDHPSCDATYLSLEVNVDYCESFGSFLD